MCGRFSQSLRLDRVAEWFGAESDDQPQRDVAPPEGFEPPTPALGRRRSIL